MTGLSPVTQTQRPARLITASEKAKPEYLAPTSWASTCLATWLRITPNATSGAFRKPAAGTASPRFPIRSCAHGKPSRRLSRSPYPPSRQGLHPPSPPQTTPARQQRGCHPPAADAATLITVNGYISDFIVILGRVKRNKRAIRYLNDWETGCPTNSGKSGGKDIRSGIMNFVHAKISVFACCGWSSS